MWDNNKAERIIGSYLGKVLCHDRARVKSLYTQKCITDESNFAPEKFKLKLILKRTLIRVINVEMTFSQYEISFTPLSFKKCSDFFKLFA